MSEGAQRPDMISELEGRVSVPMLVHLQIPALKLERKVACVLRPSGFEGVLEEVDACLLAMQSNLGPHLAFPHSGRQLEQQLGDLRRLAVRDFEHWQALVDDWKEAALKHMRGLRKELDATELQLEKEAVRVRHLEQNMRLLKAQLDETRFQLVRAESRSLSLSLSTLPASEDSGSTSAASHSTRAARKPSRTTSDSIPLSCINETTRDSEASDEGPARRPARVASAPPRRHLFGVLPDGPGGAADARRERAGGRPWSSEGRGHKRITLRTCLEIARAKLRRSSGRVTPGSGAGAVQPAPVSR